MNGYGCTQTQGDGIKPPTTTTGTAFEEDYIRELGDRIASLPQDAADELCRYLSVTHGVSWEGKNKVG